MGSYYGLGLGLGGTPFPIRGSHIALGGLIEQFPNAAAAYSLRALRNNAGNVIRVRRDSDNDERDFTASQITSGELVNWVNTEVTLPLDLRELESDGRTGSVIPAAAAYSLRNLSEDGTEVTPSDDTVSAPDGNYVVQVRRDSDNALKSFTAEEITDGTLVAWVGSIPADPENITGFTVSGITDNTDMNGTYAPAGTINGKTRWDRGGDTNIMWMSSNYWRYRFDGDTYFLSYEDTTYPWDVTTWTEQDGSGTPTFGSFVGGSPTPVAGSGFVSKWYDQSGNDRHATQTSTGSQPRIVNDGVLETDGIYFDGVDDTLSVSGEPVITATSSGTYSGFSVQTVAPSERGYLYGNASSSNGSSLYAKNDSKFTLTNKNLTLDEIPRSSGQNLLSSVYNNGDAGLLVNSGGTMTDVGTYDFAAGTSDFIIGNRNEGIGEGTILTGSISEIIVYNSDRSEDRAAIESNIGDHYNLSGPIYPNNVSGFVETWYDQSGNGNDATQTTTSLQPKIVDDGVLVENDEGKPALQGASGKFFNVTAVTGIEDLSVFFVGQVPDIYRSVLGNNNFDDRIRFDERNWEFAANNVDPGDMSFSSSLTVGDTALFNFTRYSGTAQGFANSTNASATTSNPNTNNFRYDLIFRRTTAAYNDYDLKASELIIYDSDQSSNRTAIEDNINAHYDIYS